ncbi:MAG TPA: PDZ domain-containing protein, partial [Actinomycetota bacterium]|nr:PDZ domain-containing protein [Actinomycetota bacterium]
GAISNPSAPVAYLGVVTQDVGPSIAFQLNLPVQSGALVVSTTPDGPASKAGVDAGDVIVSFDGKDVKSSQQLGSLIHQRQPGDQVPVVVVKPDGSRQTVTATLGTSPNPLA